MAFLLKLAGSLLVWALLFTVTADFIYGLSSLRPPVQDGLAVGAAIGFAVLAARIFFPDAVPLGRTTRG